MRFFAAAVLGFLVCHTVLAAALPNLDRGTVGFWRFDASDGATVKDLSPRHNDGVIEFGQLRDEKGGKSIELDGLGSMVRIAEKSPFGLSNAVSSAIWVRAEALRQGMVLYGVPNTTENWTTPIFGMYVNERHVVSGLFGEHGKAVVESEKDLPLLTWTLLTATYDGASSKLYVNGVLVGEALYKNPVGHNGKPLLIGAGQGSKPSFRGRIGELRVWDRALSADEVAALFQQTKDRYDLSAPQQASKPYKDGTVIVESPGSHPDKANWRKYPTRLLEQLDGYKPAGATVKLDRYGGWLDRPRENATGFFRATKIDGRHWLIDPDGYRYFNVGINAVQPPKNAKALFGSNEQWAQGATDALRQLGFNGLGNWAKSGMDKAKQPLPWVLRKDFMFGFAREKKLTVPASGTTGFVNSCMPVFHPDFEAFCDRLAQPLAETANDPLMVGIMTDNELQCPVNLLDRYLELDESNPDLKPNRAAAAAWLAARKGAPADPQSITARDRYEFIAFAFERYYQVVTKAIRKYDKNHMYLGSRLNYHAGEFDNASLWRMLAKYHDAVSVNYYARWGPQAEELADWEQWCGKPILLTEWYAKAADVPGLSNEHGAGWLVRTQEDRGRYYQHFVLAALEQRNIVGVHWFKYMDDAAESVALDSAGGANKGMFNLKAEPYEPLSKRAGAINHEVYPLIEFLDARR